MSGHRDDGTFAEDMAHHPARKVSKPMTFEFVNFEDLPSHVQDKITARDAQEAMDAVRNHNKKQSRKAAQEERFENSLDVEDMDYYR